ncbi:hypothetical protein OGAPHI_003723 [Ogataea philodendri]|uniref:Condensin complex subunit 1 n=1 Tax=Ogataea philodendri TaxID=1378263 RepID=A0A9P8P5F4_9ASCO|nr:uncharacterized protein OGAPHI_003723 [Ogataea philodendri]KAH3665537.1 hypothetical protein OGAPHI_003723 [Ogataea philodendri]
MEVDFNLSQTLTSFAEQLDTFELGDRDPEEFLNVITQELAVRSDAILYDEYWDPLMNLTHCYSKLEPRLQYKLAYLISSTLAGQADYTNQIINSADVDLFATHRRLLELYGYLIHVILVYMGHEEVNLKLPDGKQHWNKTNNVIESILVAVINVFKLKLNLLMETTPERNLFTGTLFLNPINALLENPDRAKVVSVKMHAFKAICMAIKYHGQSSHVQNAILQHLTYFQHSSVVMAELLDTLSRHYDHYQLTDEVLKEVSGRQFNENDTNGPKAISTFIIKLSELSPKVVMRQISLIAQLLDNNSFTLRCAVVEAVGNIITTLAKSQDEYDEHKTQADSFLELLEDRFLDINPYVRSRAIQAITKLSEMSIKFVDRRLRWSKLAVRHLEDRSGIVRRNCIKLLTSLILTHPYNVMHGDRLELSVWQKRLDETKEKLKELQPDLFDDEQENEETNEQNEDERDEEDEEGDEDKDNDSEMEVDEEEEDGDEEKDSEVNPKVEEKTQESIASAIANVDPALVNKVSLTYQYYSDAVDFIKLIHKAANVCCELLYSKSKNEVIDSMGFFVLADAYGIENCQVGIKRMLHLVWMKGSNEDGNMVVDKLIECYKSLYLSAPEKSSIVQRASYIASNLIKLTFNTSVADLASLEKLLGELYAKDYIDQHVVKVLWQFFNGEASSKRQRRGAIINLGMLALVDNGIALKGLDLILAIGLDPQSDDWILCRFACIALRRIVPSNASANDYRMSKEDEAIEKLSTVLLQYTQDGSWFGMAEEALNSVYVISSHPDLVSSKILKEKAQRVFSPEFDESEDKVVSLSQLFFLIGHIGLKTIIHLEKCETDFKKKKIASEDKKSEQQNELDMIGGTSEDDFSDAIQVVKEKEILYSENGLLAKFVPLLKETIMNPKEYNDERLQRQAILCLSKLMCISPRFCEENLGLFLKVMESSQDPVVRSNAVLGLGDMAVCFNNVVDASKDFLYGRLQDKDIMVQRTCLMTVTFLILAGQVKVKGQLAQMAKLYVNEDPGIVDMCKLFFTELATKDNAIYNGFIDMFSGLAADTELPKKSFKEIVKFVVSFLEKDKHKQQLVTKFFQRLSKTDDEDQWNDIVFAIKEIIPKQETMRREKDTPKNKVYDEVLTFIEQGFIRPEQRA